MDLEKSTPAPKQDSLPLKNKFHLFIDECNKYIADSFVLAPTASQNFIALEINADFIKLLKIDNTQTPPYIEHAAIRNTPDNAISNNEIKNTQAIADTIKSLIEEQNITCKQICMSIPRASAIIKLISVDSRLNEDEIESRIWIEANRLFPNLVGEIYLDFYVTGKSAQEPNMLDVVLVACRKEQINPYLEILERADLVPAIIDIDTYAMERALNLLINTHQTEAAALLNINFNLITLIVLHQGALIYSHELSYDGHSMMQKIRQQQTLSEAELKSVLGLHLRHALQFFYSSRPSIRIDEIYLSGDCAAMIPNLAAFIATETGKQIKIADPLYTMRTAPGLDNTSLAKEAPCLMLCCGLAISKLELE